MIEFIKKDRDYSLPIDEIVEDDHTYDMVVSRIDTYYDKYPTVSKARIYGIIKMSYLDKVELFKRLYDYQWNYADLNECEYQLKWLCTEIILDDFGVSHHDGGLDILKNENADGFVGYKFESGRFIRCSCHPWELKNPCPYRRTYCLPAHAKLCHNSCDYRSRTENLFCLCPDIKYHSDIRAYPPKYKYISLYSTPQYQVKCHKENSRLRLSEFGIHSSDMKDVCFSNPNWRKLKTITQNDYREYKETT